MIGEFGYRVRIWRMHSTIKQLWTYNDVTLALINAKTGTAVKNGEVDGKWIIPDKKSVKSTHGVPPDLWVFTCSFPSGAILVASTCSILQHLLNCRSPRV